MHNSYPSAPALLTYETRLCSLKYSIVTVHGSMGLPSAIDNFTLRFTEMDQLEEPDAKSSERWLSEIVRASANDFEDRFQIKSAEQVTPDYLHGIAHASRMLVPTNGCMDDSNTHGSIFLLTLYDISSTGEGDPVVCQVQGCVLYDRRSIRPRDFRAPSRMRHCCVFIIARPHQ